MRKPKPMNLTNNLSVITNKGGLREGRGRGRPSKTEAPHVAVGLGGGVLGAMTPRECRVAADWFARAAEWAEKNGG